MPLGAWIRIGLLLVLAFGLIWLAWVSLMRLRTTAQDRERRRRQLVNRMGRTHDAFLTDVSPELLTYQYSVNGVEYSASQEINGLAHLISDDPANLIGHVNMKYLPRNPANSILLCDQWSGLRTSAQYRQAEINREAKASRET